MKSIIITSIAYIAAQVFADYGSLKIISLGGISLDGGIFLYPLTLTIRDMVHKVAGLAAVRVVIIVTALISIYISGYFGLLTSLPGDGGLLQRNFDWLMKPVWRIVFHSLLIEVTGELLDTQIYHLWVTHVTWRFQWSRVLISNLVSVPFDSFFSLLMLADQINYSVILPNFGTDIMIKSIATIIGMPMIYMVKDIAKNQ